MQVPGLVNVDFADVRAIMTNAGSSLMGQGKASGKARARDAALAAISSPLLDVGIERATGIVWNITGPSDLTLFEVSLSSSSWKHHKHQRRTCIELCLRFDSNVATLLFKSCYRAVNAVPPDCHYTRLSPL